VEDRMKKKEWTEVYNQIADYYRTLPENKNNYSKPDLKRATRDYVRFETGRLNHVPFDRVAHWEKKDTIDNKLTKHQLAVEEFEKHHSPEAVFKAYKSIGLDTYRADVIKNIYKNGVYFLAKLELEYVEDRNHLK